MIITRNMVLENSRKQIFWYVLLTYGIAILVMVIHNATDIQFASVDNMTANSFILWILYIFSPTISAFLIAYRFNKKEGVRSLFKGYTRWNVHWKWYLGGFLLLLAPLSVGIIFYLMGQSPGGKDLSFTTWISLIAFGLVSGPVSEEGGWRGFMLPKMQSRYSASISSLILGLVWYLWHVPLYFIEGTSQNASTDPENGAFAIILSITIYFILVMATTIILTFLYNNTQGSLPVTILAHFSFNFGSALVLDSMLGLYDQMTFNIVGSVLIIAYLLFIYLYFGASSFSRKPIEELPFTIKM